MIKNVIFDLGGVLIDFNPCKNKPVGPKYE